MVLEKAVWILIHDQEEMVNVMKYDVREGGLPFWNAEFEGWFKKSGVTYNKGFSNLDHIMI